LHTQVPGFEIGVAIIKLLSSNKDQFFSWFALYIMAFLCKVCRIVKWLFTLNRNIICFAAKRKKLTRHLNYAIKESIAEDRKSLKNFFATWISMTATSSFFLMDSMLKL
jgi:hypothetical protein